MIVSRQLPGGRAGSSEGARGVATAPSPPVANKCLPISWWLLYCSDLILSSFFFFSFLFFFPLFLAIYFFPGICFLSLPIPGTNEDGLSIASRLGAPSNSGEIGRAETGGRELQFGSSLKVRGEEGEEAPSYFIILNPPHVVAIFKKPCFQ